MRKKWEAFSNLQKGSERRLNKSAKSKARTNIYRKNRFFYVKFILCSKIHVRKCTESEKLRKAFLKRGMNKRQVCRFRFQL